MNRTLQPELLDYLAPHHPDARASRRDLRWINAIMGNHRWLLRARRKWARPEEAQLELGAGDGRQARAWPGTRCDALDLQPAPADWPDGATWHQGDIRRFTQWRDYPVVFANLFFHHLHEGTLRQVGVELRRHARVVIACEPVRDRRFQWLFAALCPVIGANEVTRHDGRVSIGAGFRGNELAQSLGLIGNAGWRCAARTTLLGAYHFIAVRS
jgi:hypothetical protein